MRPRVPSCGALALATVMAALTALHQAVALTRVALRASWLAKALRTVEL